MKHRSESQPRLRQIQTARIRDGRRSNDESPLRNNYMSAQKMGGMYNPESPNPKQCHHNKPTYSPAKFQDKYDLVQTQAQSPVKRIADFEPPKIFKFQNKNQETYHGRKLEYPHPVHSKGAHNNNQNRNQKRQGQRPQTARCNSVGSRHFVDRSVKSREVQEKHAVDSQKMRVAMNYLLQTNDDYLAERSRMCNQKAKPRQQIFKINLAKTLTTYKDHYPPKEAKFDFEIEAQNEKMSLMLGPRKVCGNSTSNQFHNGVQGPRADLSTWPEGFKLQGPIDGTTTYANKFPNYGDYQKMVPIAVFNEHPLGMPFKTISTHSDHFRGQPYPRADLATWNNLHPYGNDYDPNRNTTYGSNHNSKEKQPIQQWPMYDPRLIVSKGKFSTEYKSEMKKFNEHELNHENYCQCGHCGRKGKKRIYK